MMFMVYFCNKVLKVVIIIKYVLIIIRYTYKELWLVIIISRTGTYVQHVRMI